MIELDLPLTVQILGSPCEPRGTTTVKARLLPDIAPHLASVATFAVHPHIHTHDYTVTNVETGLFVARSTTEEWAIELARWALRQKTAANILEAYKSAPPTAKCAA